MSKLMIGVTDDFLNEESSSVLSLVGEWLLLLLNLSCLLNLDFAASNSWLLLIPGVSFLKLTYRSISRSSWVSMDVAATARFCAEEITSGFFVGERIGDLVGDLMPPLLDLIWLIRWWSHTTKSSIYASVLFLSAWWSVSMRIISAAAAAGFLFAPDLHS